MGNYTKGEWRSCLTDTLPDRWTICAGEKGERGIAKTVLDNLIPPQEKEANAHLIAAAPELYEALSYIIRELDQANIIKAEFMATPQKALAKAEGRE